MGSKYYLANSNPVNYYEYKMSYWFDNCNLENIESWKQNGMTLGIL
jgi:hypothetical protein